MAGCLHGALLRIRDVYAGDASQIWSREPVGAAVVWRFMEFAGVRQKIGNMAANILLRDFNVQLRDKHTIDMPVDRNVMRVFRRIGFVCSDTHKEEVCIYRAKELCPEYPAVFDYGVWQISQNWCHKRGPQCNVCDLSQTCPRHGVE
jgi:endonuclease III